MTSTDARPRRLRITFRVSEPEHAALMQASERAGLFVSPYIRLQLVAAKPPRAARRPRIETKLAVSILERLGGVGSELHQIANAVTPAGSRNSLMPTVERELLRALASLRLLRNELLRALGRST